MRKLINTEKNAKTTLEGITRACNCNTVCRGGSLSSSDLKDLQMRQASAGEPEPTGVSANI